jgi:hypothetical protein
VARLTKYSWRHSRGAHPAREHLARRLLALFGSGIDSPDHIRMALDSIAKDWKPNGTHP